MTSDTPSVNLLEQRALEAYWKSQSSKEALLDVGAELRARHWRLQRDAAVSTR